MDGDSGFWLTGGEEPASTYGIRYFTAGVGTNLVGVGIADRNDYERLQVFGGRLWFMSKAGGPGGYSAMYRLAEPPTAAVAKPSALFSASGVVADASWNDFDLMESASEGTVVFAAAAGGLYKYSVNAVTGAWTQTSMGGPRDLISVGISHDGITVYTVAANNSYSGLFSFDVPTSQWNNDGASILVPGPNRQFRGVAAAPLM